MPKSKTDLESLITVLNEFVTKLSPTTSTQSSSQSQPPSTRAADVLLSQTLHFEHFNEEKESFTSYHQRLENFFIIKQLSHDSAECKNARLHLLINCLGSKHYQLLQSLTAPDLPSSKSYDELIILLESHLCPKPNVLIEQHKFLSRVQLPNESVAQYVAALRQQTLTCNFNTVRNNNGHSVADIFLRAQFIRGLLDTTIREKVLQEDDITFDRAVELALATEASKLGNKLISDNSNTFVNKIAYQKSTKNSSHSHSRDSRSTDRNYYKSFKNFGRTASKSRNRAKSSARSRVNFRELGIEGLCLKCGLNNHKATDFRRNRETFKCRDCGKVGHIETVCITSLTKNKACSKTQIHHINSENSSSSENLSSYNVNQVIDICHTSVLADGNKFLVPIKIGHAIQHFEADTGSPVTLINEIDYAKLNITQQIQKTNVIFRAYTQDTFTPIGVVRLPVAYGGKTSIEDLYIVPAPYAAVAGRVWIRHLGIFNLQEPITDNTIHKLETSRIVDFKAQILNRFADVFEAKVGRVPDYSVSLKLKDENIKPTFLKHRQIPYALQQKVEAELDSMEKDGIIEKADYAQWGSPLVCIPKPDGNVRLCVDYKATINKHLKETHYPIPLIDDVLNNLRGSKIFCILDIYKVYLHLQVDEESSMLQTISTHRGTYRMNRLAFGTKTAPNEFHKFIDQALQNLQNTVVYFDDIVIHGTTVEECYKHVNACLERFQQLDLHVNLGKCKLFATKIKYLGHIISAKGIEKSEEKVDAILKAPRPKNITEVRALIGCVNYYRKFLKNVTNIMYQLLKKNTRFNWTAACETAFTKIKCELASDTVLVRHDPSLPISIATDASPFGLSAVLSHLDGETEKPIAFASRSLSMSEKNYSQLDKEATAIYWAFKKFYPYIYGRQFTLITDNKPLTHIFGPVSRLPVITASRLLRYAMFLSGFNYKIQHRKSEHHANAD